MHNSNDIMLVDLLLRDCVCSLKLTHSHTHTQDVKVLMIWCGRRWIHLYFLPSLREVALLVTRMIVSLGRDFVRTHIYCTFICTFRTQECVYGRSNTHAQLTLPSPFSLPPSPLPPSLSSSLSFPLFAGSICISWKASHLGTNVTRIDLHSSAVGETH